MMCVGWGARARAQHMVGGGRSQTKVWLLLGASSEAAEAVRRSPRRVDEHAEPVVVLVWRAPVVSSVHSPRMVHLRAAIVHSLFPPPTPRGQSRVPPYTVWTLDGTPVDSDEAVEDAMREAGGVFFVATDQRQRPLACARGHESAE